MDPALWEELLGAEAGADGDRVLEAIIRLAQPGLEIPDVRIVSRFGTIATCRIRARDVIAVRARPEVISLKAPRGLSPGFEPAVGPPGPALLSLRPTDVRRSPTLALTGAGVVVACIDWGLDVDSAAFRWPDDPVAAGDHRSGGTRLLSFWDQRDQAVGPRPDPYGYGAIHSREEIDRALEGPRPYERLGYHPAIADPRRRGTHGTRTLDIAAGNGRAGGPVGIAPDADLIFVHLADRNTGGLANFGDSVRLLEAVDFISRTAGPQPCVINISAGRICAPHDGTTPVERALDELLATTPGRFLVNTAGNYVRWRAHSCGTVAPGEARTLTFVIDPEDITVNHLEIWYDGADEFAVRIDPPGYAGSRPVCLGERADLLVEGRVVGRVYHRKHDPNNGDNHIAVYLDPIVCTGDWTVTLEGRRVVSGRFHAWIERDDSCPGCQPRFTRDDSNPATTIGSIATSHLPLIVGAYDGHDPARPVASFSSAGPTRDGRAKPDLVAPGVAVLAARSAPIGASRNPGSLVRGSGTSFAAPQVTGAVALCLQAAGNRLNAHEIRKLVLDSCDPAPGADPYRLGRGYLNIPRLVADVQQALVTPTTTPGPKEPTMDTEDTIVLLAAAPATAYREYLYRPHGQLARWIGNRYDVVAKPGQRANRALQRGDVLIEVALGRMGGGRCVTLDEPELEAMRSQQRLPPGQLILRPLPRVGMSEPMAVEPASEGADAGLERLIDQGLSENQLTNALFYARHPAQSGATLKAGTNAAHEWQAIRDREVRPSVRQRLVVRPVDPVQLAIFLSQYENDPRVPEDYTKRFLTGTPLLSMGRTLRDRVIGNWRNGGHPLSASGLYQLALQTAGDPGTAALLCHNVTKAFVREGVAITWRGTGTEGEYTDGQQTYLAKVINPAGRLKYYHAAKKRDVISIFYLLFSAEEFGTNDPGDWYHYFVTATMTALASGGTLGATTGRGRREDVDSDAEERGGRVGAVAYRGLLSDRLNDLERQMTDRALASVPGYRGWVLANVLSFLEGGHYGADYTTGQSDVVRESKVHLRGAAFGLRTIGGSPGKTWRWYVPVAGSLSEADLAMGFNLKSKTAEVWGPDAKPAVAEAADSDIAFDEGHDSSDQAGDDVDEDWRGDQVEADAGEAAWAAFTPPPALATEDAPGTPIPVVLVPGIMGTRLVDPATHAKVWNPTGRRFAADAERLNNMAQLLPDPTPDNVPFYTPWLNEAAAAIPGFGNLVWEVGGQLALQLASPEFQRRALEVTGAPVRVWVAGYDWRQDNRRSAETLARVVDVALRQTGASRVVIVAHSMGGLVSRWFCRFGGADKVAALVLLGTPTHGTPQAYRALKVGLERWVGDFFAWAVFPLSWPGGRLRMLRRFPSAFQLLPTAAYCAHDRGWLAFGPTASGITDAADPVALYQNPITGFLEGPDPTVEAHLAAREQFDRALGSFMPDPTYVLFSDRLPTEARYTLAARGANIALEMGPMGHGDGTVVRYSGSAEGSVLGRGLRLPLGAVSHKTLPDYPPTIATVETIVLRTRRPTAAAVPSHEAVMQHAAFVPTTGHPYPIGESPSTPVELAFATQQGQGVTLTSWERDGGRGAGAYEGTGGSGTAEASPPPTYWPRKDKSRTVIIGSLNKKTGKIETHDFDFDPTGAGDSGKVDGPLDHNGSYKILRNEPGTLEMHVNIGNNKSQTNDLNANIIIRNGTATVTGTVNHGTPDQQTLNVNAPVKGSGTRGAPFKIEFQAGSLEWF